jgi:hypothetical protein
MRKPAQPKSVIKQTIADAAYWEKLSKALGWRLIGFTFRRTALFDTDPGHIYCRTLSVNATIRDSILNAISAAVNKAQRKFK